MSRKLIIELTEHEASCLSLACLFSRSHKEERPALESARVKLRAALDGQPKPPPDEAERYVALEC